MMSLREYLAEQYPAGWSFGSVDMAEKAVCLLPQLIWCAKNEKIMTYGELAKNVGMPPEYLKGNPLAKTAGLLAGIIGDYCIASDLPPLNVLLVQKDSKLPGDGIAHYLAHYGLPDYVKMNDAQKRDKLAKMIYPAVFQPGVWKDVLVRNLLIPGEFNDYVPPQD